MNAGKERPSILRQVLLYKGYQAMRRITYRKSIPFPSFSAVICIDLPGASGVMDPILVHLKQIVRPCMFQLFVR